MISLLADEAFDEVLAPTDLPTEPCSPTSPVASIATWKDLVVDPVINVCVPNKPTGDGSEQALLLHTFGADAPMTVTTATILVLQAELADALEHAHEEDAQNAGVQGTGLHRARHLAQEANRSLRSFRCRNDKRTSGEALVTEAKRRLTRQM